MKKTLLAVAALCAFARTGLAADTAGTAAAGFLKLPVDARDAALGEANAGRPGGPMAIFQNPGALAAGEGLQAAFSHALLTEDLACDALAAAVPLGPGMLGAGALRLGYGTLDRVDRFGTVTGTLSPADSAFALGWGLPLGPDVLAGAAVKSVSSRIYGSAATTALDLGVLIRGDDLSVGFAVQHLGPGLKFNTEASPLPVNIKLGAFIPYGERWQWLADLNFPKDGQAWLAAGGQYALALGGDWKLSARAGYNSAARDTGQINGFTGGFGLDRGALSFDYGLRTLGLLGLTHHLGVNYRWGALMGAGSSAVPAARPIARPATKATDGQASGQTRPASKKRK